MDRIVAGSRPGLVLVQSWFRPGLVPLLVLILGLDLTWSAYVLPGAQVNCSQPGLTCTFTTSDCMDPGWLVSHSYTPTGPEKIQFQISTRPDPNGDLYPVLDVNWTLKDEGSISFLTATELHVLVMSTNQHLCVRYSFREKLKMKNKRNEKSGRSPQWQFSSSVVVVEPGSTYHVSVDNIPKPELYHTYDQVSRNVTVPDCRDSKMRLTQPCIASGSLFVPHISVSQDSGSRLRVHFSPDPRSDHYSVICRCGRQSKVQHTPQSNDTRLSVSFDLDSWPRSCCHFEAEVKPFFPRCGNDCERHLSSFNFCPTSRPADRSSDDWTMLLAVGGACVALLALVIGLSTALYCWCQVPKPGPGPEEDQLLQTQLTTRPTLLLLYSQDHPLYRDVVLKLCAFLQAQCGIQVLLDLLDSASLSQVGVVRWLELQCQKLRPSDKILVLCSRGVQNKWRSMCGHGPNTFVHQPDDLIGPFLSLFLSDMHLPGSMGRYIAAYIDDISSERDVPSFFDIAVKYKLMKHFEELYFRILDMEKYEPSRVNHIEGIGPDEYYRSESGKQLKNAIETFHAFQICNPDWYENADEIATKASLLIPDFVEIQERIPILNPAPPICAYEVCVNENADNFYIVNPELNPLTVISEIHPVPNIPINLTNLYELSPTPNSTSEISSVIPVIQEPIALRSQEVFGFSNERNPTEASDFSEFVPMSGDGGRSEAVEMGEEEMEEVMGEGESGDKAQNSGSDQGYISETSTNLDSDDIKALLRLQQELMPGLCQFEMV